MPSCAEGGVLGAVAGIAGMWQVTEALKYVLGIGTSLQGRLLLIDTLHATQRDILIAADPQCDLCGPGASRRDVAEEVRDELAPLHDANGENVDPQAFFSTLESGVCLLDVREPHEAVLGIYPNSLHIPLSRLDDRLAELDLHATYLVACRLGQRSQLAMSRLRDAGVRRVLHLRGGLLAVAALEEEMMLF